MHETQRNAQAFNDAAALAAERARGEIDRGRRDQRITELERVNADLLAALKDMVKQFGANYPMNEYDMSQDAMTVCAARAAIAKAEGT